MPYENRRGWKSYELLPTFRPRGKKPAKEVIDVMAAADVVVFGIAALFISFAFLQQNQEVDMVQSKEDGNRYLVRNLSDKQEAADMLARLNVKLEKLIQHTVTKYPDDNAYALLKSNYRSDSISEGTEETNYTSYSVNKGEKIVFCLRSKETQAFVSPNTLMYVAVHELGHLMTTEVGHTPKFWKNFKRLLEEAVAIGLYTPVDYHTAPEEYCGVTIQSTVL